MVPFHRERGRHGTSGVGIGSRNHGRRWIYSLPPRTCKWCSQEASILIPYGVRPMIISLVRNGKIRFPLEAAFFVGESIHGFSRLYRTGRFFPSYPAFKRRATIRRPHATFVLGLLL